MRDQPLKAGLFNPTPGTVPSWVITRKAWGSVLVFGIGVLTLSGCQRPSHRILLDPISMADAVRIVHDNTERIGASLRASGFVDGYFTSPSGRRSYHVDAVLFYLAPTYVRFDLKAMGQRQFLFGSNQDDYWVYNREDNAFHCGRYDEADTRSDQIPVRPDQIVETLGLTAIPLSSAQPGRVHRVHRVVDEYQQILLLAYDEHGRLLLEKEYWLDRYEPRLIRRIIDRDVDGVITMTSHLEDYKPLSKEGPWLPYTMTIDWPRSGAQMRFRIAQWKWVDDVGPASIQFATPRECGHR